MDGGGERAKVGVRWLTSARRAARSLMALHLLGSDASATWMLTCSLGLGAQSTATPSVAGGMSSVRFSIHDSVSAFVRAILQSRAVSNPVKLQEKDAYL